MKKRDGYWTLVAVIIVPIVTFVGGMTLNAFTIADKIATKPYVDDRIIETKKYMDEKFEKNRSEMLLKMEEVGAELKTNGAILGTKVDALTRSVQDLRDWQVERRQRR